MTRFIDVHALSRLVDELGPTQFIDELAQTLKADFLRWSAFDKCARVASHSPGGVIEQEGYVHVSTVMLVDGQDHRPSRVRVEERDGRRVRVFARSGEPVPAPQKG